MATLAIGYDVEYGTSGDLLAKKHPQNVVEGTRAFMERCIALHHKHGCPATFFVVGKKVDEESSTFTKYLKDELIELQQHSYSHIALKPCLKIVKGVPEVVDWPTAASVEEAVRDIQLANESFRKNLGIQCSGISAPFSYALGFADRPDMLKAFHAEGIRYLRSFSLNYDTSEIAEPLRLDFPPFHYGPQGFPDMVEFCFKGLSDVRWALKNGWQSAESYLNYVKHSIDFVEQTNSFWGLALHDFSQMEFDTQLGVVDEILHYVSRRKLEVLTFGDAYKRLIQNEDFRSGKGRTLNWRIVFYKS